MDLALLRLFVAGGIASAVVFAAGLSLKWSDGAIGAALVIFIPVAFMIADAIDERRQRTAGHHRVHPQLGSRS